MGLFEISIRLDAATNRNARQGHGCSAMLVPAASNPRAAYSHAQISAPSSTESYDIIYITFCDANQERHRNVSSKQDDSVRCFQVAHDLSGRRFVPSGGDWGAGRKPTGCAMIKFSSILSRYEAAEFSQAGGCGAIGIGERTFRRWRQRFEDEGEAWLA